MDAGATGAGRGVSRQSINSIERNRYVPSLELALIFARSSSVPPMKFSVGGESMIHPILSRIPILRKFVDERFLEHRRRSTSLAGIACLMAVALFEYRLFVNHIVSWDLLAVASAMAVVKIAMMLWYRCID